MKETFEFRIWKDNYHLLPKPNKAKFNGFVYVIKLTKNDPEFSLIEKLQRQIKAKHKKNFFGYWNITRKYSKKYLDTAKLFRVKIKRAFEPVGEECGTIYDESAACEICGANRKQIGQLKLKKSSIPRKDIARTIAGEVVVSEKFIGFFKRIGLKGAMFEPVVFSKGSGYYQLTALSKLELSTNTITGLDPFDFSEGCEGSEFTIAGGYHFKFDREVYKCPKGHTMGLNLISEPYVLNTELIGKHDFFASKQKIGVTRGLLRPEPIYLCSPAFRNMVVEEKLSGFEFEIAHVD